MHKLIMHITAAALTSIVILAGCKATPSNPPQVEQKPVLSVKFRKIDGGKFEFGKMETAVFSIKNASDRAVVVLGLRPLTNHGEETIPLSASAYGATALKPIENVYEYNELVQSATSELFHAGFMLPGQEITVRCQYRPVTNSELFAVKYISADGKYDGTSGSLKPLRPYIPSEDVSPSGMTRTFKPFEEKAWLETSGTSTEAGRGLCVRAAIIPDTGADPIEQIVECAIQFGSKGFLLEDAKSAVGRISGPAAKDARIVYSNAMGGYVIFEENLVWLLAKTGQAERGAALPQIPATLLRDADTLGAVQVCVGEKQEGFGPNGKDAGRKFWDTYPVRYGDGMYMQGEFITVQAADLAKFLGKVRESKGRLTQCNYYFDSRYFVLEVPK
jgi:hypothetical protein